jgi:hypothetical protein
MTIPRPLLVFLIVLFVVPNAILLALFNVPVSPDGTNPPMVRQIASLTAFIAWLGGVGLVVGLAIWYGRLLRRLRHLVEASFSDITGAPLPMNAREESDSRQLATLGFRPLGVLEVRVPYDKPAPYWVYVNGNGWIRADVNRRNRNYVAFFTGWTDGTSLATASTSHGSANLPNYRRQGTTGVVAAYNLHVASAPDFGAGHGDVVPILSMADVLTSEERERVSLVPELVARQRVQTYVILPTVIVSLGLVIALVRPF